MKIPTLETQRLILRQISLDDAPALQEYFNNWNIIKFLSTRAPWPYPDDGVVDFIKTLVIPEQKKGKSAHWTIHHRDDGPIGLIGYRGFNVNEIDRGFWLAEPYHGQGLMSEAVAATQDYMFFDYGIERLIVRNVVSNTGSRRIKEKTGAELIRTEPDNGDHHLKEDVEVWEVTRERWAQMRN